MKTKSLCKIGVLALLFSCSACDNEYDITKDINSDISVGKGFTIPVGNTVNINVSRIIKPSETLIDNNGVYQIVKSGETSTDIERIETIIISGITPVVNQAIIPIDKNTNNSKANLKKIDLPSYNLSTEGKYDIDVLLPQEVENVSSACFSSDSFVAYLEIGIPSIPNGIDVSMEDLTITLPEIFVLKDGGNTVNFPKFTLDKNNTTHKIAVEITAIKNDAKENKYIIEKNGRKYLVVKDDKITISAKATASIDISDPSLIDVNQLSVNFRYYSDKAAEIQKISGTFSTTASINQSLELTDIPDFIKGNGTQFTPSKVYLDLSLENPTAVYLNSSLQLSSIKDGKMTTTEPVNIDLTAKPSMTNNYIISNTKRSVEGYENIVNPKLTDLLTTVPDRFEIKSDKITLKSNNTSDLFVLGRPYHSEINYKVTVPFEFENVKIEYTDSIDGLLDDLKDVADKVSELIISATGVSAIPVNLNAKVEMLDINGKTLNGINVDLSKFSLAAGTVENPSKNDIQIILTEAEGSTDLEKLEKIRYTVFADSDESLTLSSNQYFAIKDIVAKIAKGINVSF